MPLLLPMLSGQLVCSRALQTARLYLEKMVPSWSGWALARLKSGCKPVQDTAPVLKGLVCFHALPLVYLVTQQGLG